MTSERPPPRKRKTSSQPPDSDPEPKTDPDRTVVQGGWQAPPIAVGHPAPPPRMPRETMKGFAAPKDPDATMQIGSFVASEETLASAREISAGASQTPSDRAASSIGHHAHAAYPGPLATPAGSPTPYPRREPEVEEPKVEQPPDTARKVSRETQRTVSSNPPRPEPARSTNAAAVASAWEGDFNPADDVDWQQLWLATQRRTWRSLAIIPSSAAIQTLRVAEALALLAFHHLGKTIKVFDATRLALSELERSLSDVSGRVARGESVIVALGPILRSPASLTLARAADLSLLCVVLGETRIKDAEGVIAEIGAERFIGSVILDGDGRLR